VLKIDKEAVEKFLKETDFDLKPSQGKVSFPIIERIYRRLQNGHAFGSIHISKGKIVDGHHRYICLKLLGYTIEYTSGGQNTSVGKDYEWKNITIDTDDYDSSHYRDIYTERYDR